MGLLRTPAARAANLPGGTPGQDVGVPLYGSGPGSDPITF
jgi:hypothetical protein